MANNHLLSGMILQVRGSNHLLTVGILDLSVLDAWKKSEPKHVLPKWWLVMVMFIPWYNPEKKNNQTIQVLEPQYNAEDVTGYPPIMLWQSDRICKVCHIFAILNMEFFQDFSVVPIPCQMLHVYMEYLPTFTTHLSQT